LVGRQNSKELKHLLKIGVGPQKCEPRPEPQSQLTALAPAVTHDGPEQRGAT